MPPIRPEWTPAIGEEITRVDARPKVEGTATYTSDVRPAGLLYARVLRSPHPHARIRSIDTAKAKALAGVHAVLSCEDDTSVEWYDGSTLFPRTVRLAGDEVAAVAATSERIAHDALALITVDYEPLDFAVDILEAQKSDSRVVVEDGSEPANDEPSIDERGDVERGLADAAFRVEAEYSTQTAVHNALEPHGSVAMWEGEHLTIWDSTQGIFAVRKGIAEALGLDLNNVRVIKQFMGGGFGAKQIPWKNAAIAAVLAKQAGLPVQLMLDRHAENVAVGHRNATHQTIRIGADAEGHLTGLDAVIVQDIGAYKPGGEASDTPAPYHLFFACENVRTEQRPTRTNLGPAIAFRAPGYAEAAFALESAVDELAHAAGIEPLEFRLRNLPTTDQSKGVPYSAPGALRNALQATAEAFGWEQFESVREGDIRRGKGLAVQVWGGSGWPPAQAMVRWLPDGTVTVVTGTQDIGTGTRTSIAQVAADALHLPVELVTVLLGDTQWAPYSPTSAGSATLASVGPAVRAAALDARKRLLEQAARVLEVSPEAVEFQDTQGGLTIQTVDGRQRTIAEVFEEIAPAEIVGYGEREPNRDDVSIKSFGAQMAEVEVDMLMGEIRVRRIVSAQDSGQVVNPVLFQSQMRGGILQGLGFALVEQQVTDQHLGVPLNANLEEYLVPTMADVPEITVVPIGQPDLAANTIGAKGIGEPPVVGTAGAIANAVFDATGLRIRDLPITRKRILDAIRDGRLA